MRKSTRLLVFGALLLLQGVAAAEFPVPRLVDERRAAKVGIRKIVGKHLKLYTDLPQSNAVDELAAVFDAAVPKWADYFQLEPNKLDDWWMQGFLIQDRAKFAALDLLPADGKQFENGYCNGHELWLVEQPSDYYRRHLLLHEGTHGLMYAQLGAPGTGWYMEGMAELLGTHQWQNGKLILGVLPDRREDVPMWGRIRLIRDAAENRKLLKMRSIMALDYRRAFSTDEYAWCWALCKFFDSHPRWQNEFRKLKDRVNEQSFNKRIRYELRAGWPELQVEWDAFMRTLDYGYDIPRMTMHHQTSGPVTDKRSISIAADRGWQSTGWLLKQGRSYQVSASGRYEIFREQNYSTAEANTAETWSCEPGGVTIQYHQGQPLGKLLGAWRKIKNDRFSESFPIGLSRKVKPPMDAVLYLRVNDSAARLSDNAGTLSVSIRPSDASASD